MTTTESSEGLITDQILYLDPKTIIPDPDNMRGKLRGIDELVANVKANGWLEPITVREIDPEGSDLRYMVVFGHRRLAAALKGKFATIPARLDRDGDEKQRAIHRLAENIQRDDLSPVERAKGIQHALDLGLDEDAVAVGLSVDADHVRQASVIAKSPLSARAVAKEVEALELTFDQALGLAEFTGDEGIYSNLIEVLQSDRGSWDYEIASYRQQRVIEEAKVAAVREWEAKGYLVLDQIPYTVTEARRLHQLKGKGKAKTLSSAAHADCKGRAVTLHTSWDANDNLIYEASEYCMDFGAFGHEELVPRSEVIGGTATEKAKKDTAAEDAAKTLQRRTNLAMINAGKVAQTVRREFVTKLLTRKTAPPGTLRFAAEQLVGGRPGYRPNFYEMYQALTGQQDNLRSSDPAAVTYVKSGTDQHIPLGMLAFVAAEIEGAWEPNTWARSGEDRQAYMAFLVDKCGYTPSLVEKVAIKKATGADVLEDQDARRAASKGKGKAK